jgi:hypothetical protein
MRAVQHQQSSGDGYNFPLGRHDHTLEPALPCHATQLVGWHVTSGPGQADTGFTRHALHDFWLHLGGRVASAVDGVLDSMIIPSPGAYAT